MDSLPPDARLLAYSAILTWFLIMLAPTLRNREWTWAGLKIGFGNRDDLPEPTPLVGRAERAARNALENLVLFVACLVAARMAGVEQATLDLGARIFFWGRVGHAACYLAGIPYLRTLAWAVGVVGTGILAAAVIA
jgi:uncharacterized MAPEG superfamily protein